MTLTDKVFPPRKDFDQSFVTMPRPTHPVGILHKPKNSLSWKLFGIWAWSPIVSFQVGLTAGYLALVYFGISALIAAPPSIDTTTPHWYAWFWGIGLLVGAILSLYGSVSRKRIFELLETFGSSLLTLTVGSYALIVLYLAYVTGDQDRIAAGAGFMALAVPIIVRCMWLWSQFRRK